MALYTLQFSNYTQARTAAIALGFWDTETDQLRTDGQSQDASGAHFGWNIDIIGQDPTITPAVVDEEGNIITPAVTRAGYFANVTGQLPPGADAYLAPFYGYAGRYYGEVQEPRLHEGQHPDGTVLGETMLHGGLTWEWTAEGWRAREH